MSLESGLAGIDKAKAIAMANAMNFDGTRMKTPKEMAEYLGTRHLLMLRFPAVFAVAKHLVDTEAALTSLEDPSPMAASESRGFEKGVNAAISTFIGLGLTGDLHVPELPKQPDQSAVE